MGQPMAFYIAWAIIEGSDKPQSYKTFFMLNSTEHEISIAPKR